MNQKLVEINGTIYDKQTGMPIRRTDVAPTTQRTHATSIHRTPQKSTTLHRRYVQKQVRENASPKRTSIKVTTTEVKRSPMIQKYAAHPVAVKSNPEKRAEDKIAAPTIHPMVQQMQAARAVKRQPAKQPPKPSDVLKAEAVKTALESAPSHNRTPRRDKSHLRTKKQRMNRMFSFASSGAALLLIAGYFTYINMPNLSVRVAAVQAGIHADYPGYQPSGYSLAGPVSYDAGTVAMQFDGNGSDRNFTLTQTKSGWDSTAVYENYVAPRVADDTYTTTTSGGLTIYSWNGNAAWVNRGILYTVDGDALLTPDQVQRMAASL